MADGNRRTNRRKVRVAVAACAIAALPAGCGEKEEPEPGQAPTVATTTARAGESAAGDRRPPPRGQATAPAESPPHDPRLTALERSATRVAADYVKALDAGDGDAVCRLLVPGALRGFELPEHGDDCATALSASIGYRDPRGLPVWEGAEARMIRVAELGDGGHSAKVVATIETTFADRDEVSIEDDLIYLIRPGARWLVAKPSTTLYRAVGIAEIPPSVLTPPEQ